jgi:uncharacterized protein (DUF952 family)
MQNEVFKVLTLEEWGQAQDSGIISTEIDQKDGFVHLSFLSQLHLTLSLYFNEEEKVMLLQLDQSRIKNKLKFETPIPSGKRLGVFPHYYGHLELGDVSSSWQLKKDAFEVPIEILLKAETRAS